MPDGIFRGVTSGLAATCFARCGQVWSGWSGVVRYCKVLSGIVSSCFNLKQELTIPDYK